MVSTAVAAALLPPIEQPAQSRAARPALGHFSNLRFGPALDYFDAGRKASPFLHTGSLGVEEQFYVF